jgi:hypothetical protein
MAHLKFDALDRQILAALDGGFVVEDNELAVLRGAIAIEIVRVADDRLEMMVEFAKVKFPIVMSRSRTAQELGVKESGS